MIERWVRWEGEGVSRGKYMHTVVAERFNFLVDQYNVVKIVFLCNKKSLFSTHRSSNFYSQQEHDKYKDKRISP
jgi:hypothetical protein